MEPTRSRHNGTYALVALEAQIAVYGPPGANRRPSSETETASDAAPAFVWAYGDSSGDRELFARADQPTRV